MADEHDPLLSLLPESEAGARRYIAGLLLLICLFFGLQASFNFLINPRGHYDSPLHNVDARTVRRVKLDLLAAATPAPQALILGSSRVRSLPPAHLEGLFRLPTFHAGGPKSAPSNWLTITSHVVKQLGYPLKLVVIGVDPSSFIDVVDFERHPIYSARLRPFLRRPWVSWISSRRHLLSARQTRQSWLLLTGGYLFSDITVELGVTWNADGFRTEYRPLDAERILDDSRALHAVHIALRREHEDDFRALLELAQASDLQILTFMTPETEEMRRYLGGTTFRKTRQATVDLLQQTDHPKSLFCDIDSLPLGAADFVDPHHTTIRASQRILDLLSRCAEEHRGG